MRGCYATWRDGGSLQHDHVCERGQGHDGGCTCRCGKSKQIPLDERLDMTPASTGSLSHGGPQ